MRHRTSFAGLLVVVLAGLLSALPVLSQNLPPSQRAIQALDLVSDINQLPAGIGPSGIVSFNGNLHFAGSNPANGVELYRLNGTTPVLIRDLVSGPSGSYPFFLTPLGSKLVFSAFEPATGRELYAYDGTNVTRLTDVAAGPENSIVESAFQIFGGQYPQLNGVLYFVASDGNKTYLYQYNGTNVSQVTSGGVPIDNVAGPVVYNNKLYLFRYSTTSNEETLYAYENGTLTPIETFESSLGTSSLFGNTLYNGNLVFVAVDGGELALFSFNGATATRIAATAGTEPVEDPLFPTAVGNKLYFVASTAPTGTELFVYDGTNTQVVQDITPGTAGTSLLFLNAFGNRLFFFRDNPAKPFLELNAVDGNTVSRWSDLDPTAFYPLGLYPVGNTLYASAFSASHGGQIWTLQGNTSTRVTGASAGTMGSNPHALTQIGNNLYFGAWENLDKGGLYRFNGTSSQLYSDVDLLGFDSEIQDIVEFSGRIYFTVQRSEDHTQLYSTNGTNTTLVQDNTNGDLAVFNQKLYFGAKHTTGDYRLYSYDGQNPVLAPDASTTPALDPEQLITFGGKLYFSASTVSAGLEFFSYDGTRTSLVQDLLPGPVGLGITDPVEFQNQLYFVSGGTGTLYRFNGTTATPVAGVTVSCTFVERCLVPGGSDLYFPASVPPGRIELFRFNGTQATQLTTGTAATGYNPWAIAYLGGKVYFSGDDASQGRELFVYENNNPRLLEDFFPGYEDATPSSLTVFQDKLYFAATSPSAGEELFSFDPGGSTDAEDEQPVAGIALEQSFPNPASRLTNLAYTLPRAMEVRLGLYDVLGRRVRLLADGVQAAGRQTLAVPVDALPAGVYFYRLEADGRVFSRSLIVTR